ncbi:hypothetical protein EDB81DRAFT_804912 [Dactylonectria macrodidyma]|uniref:Secreted protein n=1 Tax=Dactylonectria macrodidyma TaxID=307937 RepID=A0A9P9EBU3_9HYPO|nr:hypothetical protein EDB81DRAFT_804912 [Dactylonectria macrodidyma]
MGCSLSLWLFFAFTFVHAFCLTLTQLTSNWHRFVAAGKATEYCVQGSSSWAWLCHEVRNSNCASRHALRPSTAYSALRAVPRRWAGTPTTSLVAF